MNVLNLLILCMIGLLLLSAYDEYARYKAELAAAWWTVILSTPGSDAILNAAKDLRALGRAFALMVPAADEVVGSLTYFQVRIK